VSPLILVVLLWTSGRGISVSTWIVGHLQVILICIHESKTANAPRIINGAPSLPRGPSGWSHIRQTTFLDTRSLILPVTVLQRGSLQTMCPHPMNWNCDLDSQYLPYLWLEQSFHDANDVQANL